MNTKTAVLRSPNLDQEKFSEFKMNGSDSLGRVGSHNQVNLYLLFFNSGNIFWSKFRDCRVSLTPKKTYTIQIQSITWFYTSSSPFPPQILEPKHSSRVLTTMHHQGFETIISPRNTISYYIDCSNSGHSRFSSLFLLLL